MVYKAAEERYDNLPARRMGDTGMILPSLSLGFWKNMGGEQPLSKSREVILNAFDNGIFSFDNAASYSSGAAEETFGHVFEKDLKAHRNELVVTTKAGFHVWPGPFGEFSSKKTFVGALDLSLQRMHLDYVDIFYAHRWDPHTNLRETAETMDLMVRQGKALYVGVSNYTTEQFNAIAPIFAELGTPFVGNQVSYNMLNRNAETTGIVDAVGSHNKGLVAYGPLAEGLLSDRYLAGIPADMPIHWSSKYIFDNGTENIHAKIVGLNEIAQQRGQKLSQMALAWLLKDPRVGSVIIGASQTKHLLENIKMSENMDFSNEELNLITEILNK
ncbi:aldo/keto reductase [Periweissella cryptocerci]|uniref:Aldo/keto reductase n=1 Tax=Periweissella cryptocerci TaxID=2506420 RepID=A0A4P6YUL6_9LACO|nr:aldo/keto reductase [Periweissella cryptocerci]QBO36484.1 aldo/keto reductase [Periweissella cryptocerci]